MSRKEQMGEIRERLIKHAMKSLGEYGACEVCGKESEVERLEAVHWTSVCHTHARKE